MSEAKQLHDDLLNALLPLIPRTTYQESHRLNTLVWAVTGLCLTHTVRLGAWAEILESRAQYAASRVRRFSRWLHHPAIHPHEWYLPVVQAALTDWPVDQRLYVTLDTTALTPFVLIRASLVYRGRAISSPGEPCVIGAPRSGLKPTSPYSIRSVPSCRQVK